MGACCWPDWPPCWVATACCGVRRLADRVVALDVLFAVAVLLCVCAALITGRTAFLDIALGLALTGFVGTLAWARLIDRRHARARREE